MISKHKKEKMDLITLAQDCARVIDDKKGEDTLVIDLMEVNNYLDYFIITTGNSIIHCKALAKEVQSFFKEHNLPERTRAQLDSSWIVLDFNAIVVHIFTGQMRDYYQLEKLWGDARMIDY